MASIIDFFKVMIIVQMFFSFGITILVYSMPEQTQIPLSTFGGLNSKINFTSMGTDLNQNIQQQKTLPLVDVGSLVFYSGNLIIDLIGNFAFAVPEMAGLVLFGFVNVFHLPAKIVATVQLFLSVLILALYVVSLLQLLTGIRSGRIA